MSRRPGCKGEWGGFVRLDAKDSHVCEWIGSPSGKAPRTLNGNGAPVIGFHGRAMAIVDAVGLVFAGD